MGVGWSAKWKVTDKSVSLINSNIIVRIIESRCLNIWYNNNDLSALPYILDVRWSILFNKQYLNIKIRCNIIIKDGRINQIVR